MIYYHKYGSTIINTYMMIAEPAPIHSHTRITIEYRNLINFIFFSLRFFGIFFVLAKNSKFYFVISMTHSQQRYKTDISLSKSGKRQTSKEDKNNCNGKV